MDPVKQIIVIRKDLGMRRGKEIAQGAHASMAWLARRVTKDGMASSGNGNFYIDRFPVFSAAEHEWLTGTFTKICVVVDSEHELYEVLDKATRAGLCAHLITDAGKTEFNGMPTNTCIAIGPDYASKIDPVCKHLKLY